MRAIAVAWLLGCLSVLPAFAEQVTDNAVRDLSGTGPTTLTTFHMKVSWEVRWAGSDAISITVYSAEDAVVTSATNSAKGSLFVAREGDYHISISRTGDTKFTWHLLLVNNGAAASSVADLAAPAPTGTPTTNNATATSPPSPTAASTNTASASPPASPTPEPPPEEKMPEALTHAVVVIKGDEGEGSGFLVKTADGPSVVTNNHVIRANPNVHIFTTAGAEIKTLGLKGAADRDLVVFKIEDKNYDYFELATDIPGTVHAGDTVITPGNSQGGGVVLTTKGTVKGVGPEQVEFSNPIYHGNSGGPVYHFKSGKVIAAVTFARKVDTSNDLDKASFADKNSAIVGSMRYFGLRLDTVPKWEAYDWVRFLRETAFLQNFRMISRCLDSYLNGDDYEKEHIATTDEDGPPNGDYYLRNQKLAAAEKNYHRLATEADQSQRLDAGREWVMTLEGVASQDMEAIQDPRNFYTFNQTLAQEEIDYRKALRKEIQGFGDKLGDRGH